MCACWLTIVGRNFALQLATPSAPIANPVSRLANPAVQQKAPLGCSGALTETAQKGVNAYAAGFATRLIALPNMSFWPFPSTPRLPTIVTF